MGLGISSVQLQSGSACELLEAAPQRMCMGLPAEVHEAELLEELPRHMRGRIVSHLLHEVLSASELFSRLDASARAMLAASLRPVAVLPGHDLCRAGDPAECMWILQTGTPPPRPLAPPARWGPARRLECPRPCSPTGHGQHPCLQGGVRWGAQTACQ